ncbi:hypothetical protein CN085_10825 [Sinorhizobium meliloti]|nr:hypothetical protein CN085_10825 [Sinorhizobium meliloti]
MKTTCIWMSSSGKTGTAIAVEGYGRPSSGLPATFSPFSWGEGHKRRLLRPLSPPAAGESHLANKRLFCCGKSILGVLR